MSSHTSDRSCGTSIPELARLPVAFQRGTFAKIKIIFESTKDFDEKIKEFVRNNCLRV
jgi:hypothetical protein